MQIAQNIITRIMVTMCSFLFIADHSFFCFFATNPMRRPIPVPAKAPSATIIRISNKFASMQALSFRLPIHPYNRPCDFPPVRYLSFIFGGRWIILHFPLFSPQIPHNQKNLITPAIRSEGAGPALRFTSTMGNEAGTSNIVISVVRSKTTITLCSAVT